MQLDTSYDPKSSVITTKIKNIENPFIKKICDKTLLIQTDVNEGLVNNIYVHNLAASFMEDSIPYLRENLSAITLQDFLQNYFEFTPKTTLLEFFGDLSNMRYELIDTFEKISRGKKIDENNLKFKLSKILISDENFQKYFRILLSNFLENSFDLLFDAINLKNKDKLATCFFEIDAMKNYLNIPLGNFLSSILKDMKSNQGLIDSTAKVMQALRSMKSKDDIEVMLREVQKIHLADVLRRYHEQKDEKQSDKKVVK